MKDDNTALHVAIAVFVVTAVVFWGGAYITKAINNWSFGVQKADDETNYKTLKEVEDTCRAMISNYEADRLLYEQFKDSTDDEERSWAQSAKIRANKTASQYNNYVLKNSFVFKDNVPDDIKDELEYID
ncbi:MAG: hypothetical protein K6F00_08430 [Lachnospiraceae bacterium]|nr:hypothetical protein [Lachnospiraceae bacterium]